MASDNTTQRYQPSRSRMNFCALSDDLMWARGNFAIMTKRQFKCLRTQESRLAKRSSATRSLSAMMRRNA